MGRSSVADPTALELAENHRTFFHAVVECVCECACVSTRVRVCVCMYVRKYVCVWWQGGEGVFLDFNLSSNFNCICTCE